MNHYRSIGKIVSAFGLNGEMILVHHLGKRSSLKGLEVLFIEKMKDEMLPYFLESARIKSETETYVKLEGIDVKERTKSLIQKQVWLTEEDYQKFAAKTSAGSLLGYHIIDQQKDLGEILEVIEQPHQLICRIVFNAKEALIPLHEETIRKIDRRKKQVIVELPEGLLEVYG